MLQVRLKLILKIIPILEVNMNVTSVIKYLEIKQPYLHTHRAIIGNI